MNCFVKLIVFLIINGVVNSNQAKSQAGVNQPNIIILLTDDQGYGDLGRHGHPLLKTPNMDRLYDESVRFDNFYVSPSCSPTRASLMTGMHEFKNGVTHTIVPREHLNIEATILPQLLKTVGYKTGFIGKWHLGGGEGYSPKERGFDIVPKVPGNGKDFSLHTFMNGEEREAFREDIYFDEAMSFIEQNNDDPFFLYLATYAPHTPLVAPEKDIAPYRVDGVSEAEATYLGEIANVDKNLGKLLKFLEDKKLDENTIVILMNDNGVTMGLDVYNAGMRGCKCTIWHGGSRAMSFWRWPNTWKPHVANNLTAHLDVLPTLCDITGVEIPEEIQSELDGFSLVPLLENEEPQSWHDDRYLFQHVARWPAGLAASHKYAMCGVRQGSYLLLQSAPCSDDALCLEQLSQCTFLRATKAGGTSETYTKANAQFHWGVSPQDTWVLYDTNLDPACQNNLSETNPELVKSLSEAYDNWWEAVYPEMIRLGGDKGEFRPVGNYVRNK
ncbi:arylsulfatase [Formosa sp. PL04]|uniref:arylsulfatase n=1 Tax=Formosa sp. PL04 TaxID=3081755 RepID=UPI0029813D18|nr:arylsulfatase [Formosa sp. PL04]MDW5290144.1 arylsulfatase [Formosa sp. PL04]